MTATELISQVRSLDVYNCRTTQHLMAHQLPNGEVEYIDSVPAIPPIVIDTDWVMTREMAEKAMVNLRAYRNHGVNGEEMSEWPEDMPITMSCPKCGRRHRDGELLRDHVCTTDDPTIPTDDGVNGDA